LGLQSKEIEQIKEDKLISFLEFAGSNASELFILGDLFDYWFEYRRVYQKGYFRTLTALYNIVKSGVNVHYFIGNHDFMHRDFFEKEIGLTLYYSEKEFILEGKRFFLGHGDGLVNNDLGYKVIKKILRNRFIQNCYSLIHPDLGIKIASLSSKTSRDYTSKKDYGENDGLCETAERLIIENGYDFVIFGHRHLRKIHNYNKGIYINLGTWLEQSCYGKYENEKFDIIDWI